MDLLLQRLAAPAGYQALELPSAHRELGPGDILKETDDHALRVLRCNADFETVPHTSYIPHRPSPPPHPLTATPSRTHPNTFRIFVSLLPSPPSVAARPHTKDSMGQPSLPLLLCNPLPVVILFAIGTRC